MNYDRTCTTKLFLAGWVLVAGVGDVLGADGQAKAQKAVPVPWSPEWVGPFEPVVIDGKVWSFHTPPPPRDERKVTPGHPRIFMTRSGLPALRQKLEHPAYKPYISTIVARAESGCVCASALLYHLGFVGDKEAYGRKAKELALAGKFPTWGGGPGERLGAILAYDWTADLLTLEERKIVFKHMVSKFEFDAKWTHQGWYGNDPYVTFVLAALVPLAAYGDGVDDQWCENTLNRFYEGDADVMGMYGPRDGRGLLDVLNTIGLDTGGSQAGNHAVSPTTGYTSMYLHGAPLLAMGWEHATGEPILRQLTWLRYLPHWLAYESYRWKFQADDESDPWAFVPGAVGLAVLEYMTGQHQQIDPDMAALAAWHVKNFGTYKYPILRRAILGDLRLKPKGPTELELPTAAYLRGADTLYSRNSWDENATCVKMHVRYLDTNRYEHHTNTFTIAKFGRLAPGSRPGKGTRNPGNHSGLWFYEKGGETENPARQQGSTYWNRLRYRTHRAAAAREVVEDPIYRAGGPLAVGIHEGYRFASADAARLLSVQGAKRYERTLVHLLPTAQDREFVVVHDRTEATENAVRAWGLRTSAKPVGDVEAKAMGDLHLAFPGGSQVTIANRRGNCHGLLHLTAVLPEDRVIEWRGDADYQGVSPHGQPYGLSKRRSSGETKPTELALYQYGMGNLFIQAEEYRPKQNYLMVIEIGDANTLTADNAKRVIRAKGAGSDVVQVDEWALAFATEPARRKAITYTLAADGAKRHIIFDLEPGAYEVTKNGSAVRGDFQVEDKDFSMSISIAAAGKADDEFAIIRK